MTDVGRMSVQELVGKVLADEHADVLRQAVVWLAQELGESSCAAWSAAAWPGCSWSSPTPTKASRPPSPRC